MDNFGPAVAQDHANLYLKIHYKVFFKTLEHDSRQFIDTHHSQIDIIDINRIAQVSNPYVHLTLPLGTHVKDSQKLWKSQSRKH